MPDFRCTQCGEVVTSDDAYVIRDQEGMQVVVCDECAAEDESAISVEEFAMGADEETLLDVVAGAALGGEL